MLAFIQNLGSQASGDTFESLRERHGKKYPGLAIASVGVGTFIALLMSTIINVAIPDVMGAFGVDQSDAQWLSTGFLASSTISMLVSGWVIDRFGVQNAFFYPSLVFILGSMLAAVSPNIETLIIARVIQGIAYGFYMPIAMYVMTRIFPPEKQDVGMAIFGVMAVLGPALGPYLGGLAVDAFGWRSVFYLPLPIALIGLPLTLWYLPGYVDPNHKARLDIKSVVWLSVATSSILIGLSNGQRYGWGSDFVFFCLGTGAFATAAFISQQLVSDAPLLNLRLFRNRDFANASIVSVLFGMGMFGGMYAVPLFLQTIQGITATEAGLAMLPAGIVMTLVFPIFGALSDKAPPNWVVMFGVALMAYATGIMVLADRFTPFWTICWWLILSRIGMSAIMPSMSKAAMSSLPTELMTSASGAFNFIRQLGGAIGVNLTSVAIDRRTTKHMDYINSLQNEENSQTGAMITRLIPELHKSGVDMASQEPLAAWIMQKELYRQAMSLGFQDTFLYMGLLLAIGVIPAYYLGRKK
ncbi:MAG: DHA2 family efflux MFS transporter permease subunit [Candidatus Pelagadaptatus aseana]|uniref:DHA2 family efflux MFS transporter permease subunit n=1 Tax=Candidatus Pelagadaptatus aseana TaxID=3120508 RepID=UPI0039B349DB